jgi:hypothetical protein
MTGYIDDLLRQIARLRASVANAFCGAPRREIDLSQVRLLVIVRSVFSVQFVRQTILIRVETMATRINSSRQPFGHLSARRCSREQANVRPGSPP